MSIVGNTEVKNSLVGNIHLLKTIPGYSAYEIAVKHGYEGTEAEWVASLKGDKGDPGTLENHSEIDALGNRVVNVADPVEDTDAVNLKHFKYVEDITDDFIATTLNDNFSATCVSVRKQGNVISGLFYVVNVVSANGEYDLFTINDKYLPHTEVHCGTDSIDWDNKALTSSPDYIKIYSRGKCAGNFTTNPAVTHCSFTYICK